MGQWREYWRARCERQQNPRLAFLVAALALVGGLGQLHSAWRYAQLHGGSPEWFMPGCYLLMGVLWLVNGVRWNRRERGGRP